MSRASKKSTSKPKAEPLKSDQIKAKSFIFGDRVFGISEQLENLSNHLYDYQDRINNDPLRGGAKIISHS